MSATSKIKGLKKNARSPGSIHNAEHHDPTGSSKGIDGTPLNIEDIITPTTEEPIENCAIVRVYNADAGVQYIWSGQITAAPGTVDATTGIALAPGSSEVCYLGFSDDDQESLGIKTSDAAVQVVKLGT